MMAASEKQLKLSEILEGIGKNKEVPLTIKSSRPFNSDVSLARPSLRRTSGMIEASRTSAAEEHALTPSFYCPIRPLLSGAELHVC